MTAEVGDELIVESTLPVHMCRVGTIVGLKNTDGSPPYLVHWVVGDYDSLIFPGPNTQMKVHHKAQHASQVSSWAGLREARLDEAGHCDRPARQA